MKTDQIDYQTGIPDQFKSEVVALYDEAFGKKIAVAIKDKKHRQQLLMDSLVLDYGIAAVANDQLLGIAGFHTPSGSLTGGITYRDLLSRLGFIRGNWAALVFGFYERKPKLGELLMDGISVRSDAQGQGIGTSLLYQIKQYAIQHGFYCVRLDVIDTNSAAKRLYERMGFTAVDTTKFPSLEGLLGFSSVTTMRLRIKNVQVY